MRATLLLLLAIVVIVVESSSQSQSQSTTGEVKQVLQTSSTSSTISSATSATFTPSTDPKEQKMQMALLSGDQEAVRQMRRQLGMSKTVINALYKPLQYIIGLKRNKPFAKRCYADSDDSGMYLAGKSRASGRASLMMSTLGGEPTGARNTFDLLGPSKVSKVGDLANVCGSLMPLSENGRLIQRQPSYVSCGGSVSLMMAYDLKCTSIDNLCKIFDKCWSKGIPAEKVKKYIDRACANDGLSVKVYTAKTFAGIKGAVAKYTTMQSYDLAVLYMQHWLYLHKRNGQVLVSDSFCGFEGKADAADERDFIRTAISIVEVKKGSKTKKTALERSLSSSSSSLSSSTSSTSSTS